MCGIFGFWLNRPLGEDDFALGRRATGQLAHRGPDGQGEWSDGARGIYLGHRRLAILDLSEASDQPMARSGVVVAYNGEVYNFTELRDELKQFGHSFDTTGDTEVLLTAWRHWGESCLNRLDGMFAFGLFDGNRLRLATDPFGEKPLYVAETEDGVYFASEPRVLIDNLGLSFQPSPDEIAQFLAVGFIPSPATGFPGLSWLPPGCVRTYFTPRQVTETRYWLPALARSAGKPDLTETDVDDLAGILVRSLGRRLRADVPIGLFLSSGVDSALVGALASRELGVALHSLTVSFPDGTDEADGASAIAAHLGLPHVVIDSRADESWGDMPQALDALYGVPNDNVTALSVLQMCRLARQQMTVALSGTGGDEAFFGYNKYGFLYKNRWAYRIPPTLFHLLRPMRGILDRLPRWQTIARLLEGCPQTRFLALKNAEMGDLMRHHRVGVPPLPDFTPARRDLLLAARDFDLRQTLPASYVAAVERGSMRASMEVRTPYLSRELFEFVAEFQPSAMIAGGQKIALRRLLRRYLPADLVERPKQGFVFPLKRYLGTLGDQPPSVPGLPADAIAATWARRLAGGSDTIALRLTVLEYFERVHGRAPAP